MPQDTRTSGYGSGENLPVGHAFQVLAVLLMQAGAYLPAGFKETVHDLNQNDPYARHPSDPLRPLVIANFEKLLREYDVVHPFCVVGDGVIKATRILIKQYPHPMFWGGPPEEDAVWTNMVNDQYKGSKVERCVLTRESSRVLLLVLLRPTRSFATSLTSQRATRLARARRPAAHDGHRAARRTVLASARRQ